jgi:hypothetical protein
MPATCIVMKLDHESLAALCVALMAHAERLNSLLKPSWLDAEKCMMKCMTWWIPL